MADAKISALTELTVPPDLTDEFVVVDKSDTSEAASGTDKRIMAQTLIDRAIATAISGMPTTGVTYQNFTRYMAQLIVTIGPTATGTLKLMAIWLPAGFTVNNISFVSGTTGLTTSGSGPHFWVGLFDSARVILRQSTDVTNATWSASSLKTTTLSSAFVTTYTGLHYCGLLIAQGSTGTPPTLTGSNLISTGLSGLAPLLSGNSTTSLGATATGTAETAITSTTGAPWCGVA